VTGCSMPTLAAEYGPRYEDQLPLTLEPEIQIRRTPCWPRMRGSAAQLTRCGLCFDDLLTKDDMASENYDNAKFLLDQFLARETR
jgi:hypothetical protein